MEEPVRLGGCRTGSGSQWIRAVRGVDDTLILPHVRGIVSI
jgi:hypothetical protein